MLYGSLEVIVGCMSSGKSEEMLRRLRRSLIAKRGVIVFKPQIDTRSGNEVVSRNGQAWEAVTIETPEEALSQVLEKHTVIGFDEAQFFNASILTVTEQLVMQGKRVIVAGLDTDFRGQPFGYIPQLLAMADEVTKLSAICMKCGETATRSYRKEATGIEVPAEGVVVVAGDVLYEARCRSCHAN